MLGMTRAEAKAVRTFIVGAGCLKMPNIVALKTGLPIMGVVRLQWGKSKLTIQGPTCADFIHQLSPVKHLFCLLREGGWDRYGVGHLGGMEISLSSQR